MRSISLLAAPVLLAAALAAGCSSARPTEASADVDRLRRELGEAFAGDARFASRVDVSVSASRGVVTLAGEVAKAGDIEEAAKLATSVGGVSVLYNLLEVERVPRAVSQARATKPTEVVAGTP